MKVEEIRELDRYPYRKRCDRCGREITVYTQEDDDPEYYTDIYVPCVCGNYLKFKLPVD